MDWVLKLGVTVYSVYDDSKGVVVGLLKSDRYKIKWADNTITSVSREEIY